MNSFCVGYHSDRGTTHDINQDSFFIKGFNDESQKVLVAGLFDGMGGHNEGERASGAAAQVLSRWANTHKDLLLQENDSQIIGSLDVELFRLNEKIRAYGVRAGIEVGTTAAVLIIWEKHYLVCNVGDSRAYLIKENRAEQITEDHSLVADLVRAGLITESQAKKHPRRNVLTQALGILEKIKPFYRSGFYNQADVFLLLCDGFYHELADTELQDFYRIDCNRGIITERLKQKANEVIARGETDNITGILIKTIAEV